MPQPSDTSKVRKQSKQTNENSQRKVNFECWVGVVSRGQLFLGETKLLSGQVGKSAHFAEREKKFTECRTELFRMGGGRSKDTCELSREGEKLGGLQNGQTFRAETQPRTGVK